MSADSISAHQSTTTSASSRWLSIGIRIPLALLALWLVYRAELRFSTWNNAFLNDFKFHASLWMSWIGVVVLAGLAFGLAAWTPWPLARIRYRWSRLILAAIAAVPIAEFTYVQGYLLPRYHVVRGWLATTMKWFGQEGSMFALGVLVGVALAAGVVRRDEASAE